MTNVATLALARAVAGVGHIVGETNGTWTAYLQGERELLPRHATRMNTYIVSGQSNAVATSTWIPKLSPMVVTDGVRPANFLVTAVSGTTALQWQPGGALYIAMTAAIRGAQGTIRGILWWQGELDAANGTAEATYRSQIATIAAAVVADFGINLMLCKIQNMPLYDETAVNAAISDLWLNDPNVLNGPDFSDQTPAGDGIHFAGDTELQMVADRWLAAIEAEGLLP